MYCDWLTVDCTVDQKGGEYLPKKHMSVNPKIKIIENGINKCSRNI